MENGSLFSLVSKLLTFIGDCCFSKLAHLSLPHCPLVSLVNQYPPCCPNVPLFYCTSQCLNDSCSSPPHHCPQCPTVLLPRRYFLTALPSFCRTPHCPLPHCSTAQLSQSITASLSHQQRSATLLKNVTALHIIAYAMSSE
jgi:hypothetical protein